MAYDGRTYIDLARRITETDDDLALDLIASLHRTVGLPPSEPNIVRLQRLHDALRIALAEHRAGGT